MVSVDFGVVVGRTKREVGYPFKHELGTRAVVVNLTPPGSRFDHLESDHLELRTRHLG